MDTAGELKHVWVRRQLQDLVASTLRPGDALLGERQLEEQFGVSRITVRRAISDLVQDGALVRIKGKGTFVSHGLVRSTLHLASFNEDMRQAGFEPSTRVITAATAEPPAAAAEHLGLAAGAGGLPGPQAAPGERGSRQRGRILAAAPAPAGPALGGPDGVPLPGPRPPPGIRCSTWNRPWRPLPHRRKPPPCWTSNRAPLCCSSGAGRLPARPIRARPSNTPSRRTARTGTRCRCGWRLAEPGLFAPHPN